eukprot:TRINITY_DN9665_c0_g2_i1.p1 TRINITY_DN9665_c0_g2~~TRINITY_DN9665_c0_g2_i1.p1  ORF type:complete len:982 (+),score=276.97 TRINITY_DN9665_c0_g2_i1:41-2986(+)
MDFGQLDHRLSVIARDVTNAVGRVAESRILMQMGRDEASAKHMQELLVEMLRGVVSGEQEAEVQRLSERNKILEVQLETCRGKLREVETALRQTKTEMEGKGETEWERDLKISQLEGRLEASEGNLKAVQDRYRKEIANSTIVPENYFQKQQQNETSIMWEAHAASQTAKQLETLRISAASITSLLTRYDPTLTVSGMLDVVGGVASRCMEFFVPIFASPYEVQRISEARSVVHEYMSKLKTTHRKLKAALRDKDTSLRDSQDTSSLQNALRSLELDLSKSNQRRQRAEQAADSWREKHGSLEMEVSKIQSELSRQETDHKMHTLLSTHMSDVLKVVHTMQAANTAVAAGTGQSNVSNNSDVNATNAFLSEFQSYLTTAIGKERQQQQQQQPPQQPAQEKEKEQDISLHYIPKAAHMQEMHELETHLLRDTKGWVEKKEISWEKTLHDTQQKLETAKDERDKMALTNIEKSNLINMLEARVASLTSELTESKRGATLQKERRSLAEQAVAALKAEVMTLQKAMPVEVSPLPPPPPSSDLPSIHTLLHDGIASLLMELRCLDLGHGTEQIRDLLEDGCQGDLSEVDVTKMIKAKVRVALRVCTASLQRVKRVQTIHAEKIFNMKRRLLGEVSTVRSAAAEVYSTAKAEVWQMAVEVEKAGEAIVGAMGAIRAPTPPPAPSYAETVRPMTAIAPLLQQHLEGVSESVLGVLADPVSEVTFVLAVAELETVLKRNSTTAKRVQEELLGLQKEHSALGTAQHQTLAELEGAKGEVSEAMKTIDSLQRKIRSAVEANEKSEGEARAARGEAEAALSKAVEEKEGVRAAEGELNNVIAGQREDIAKLTANIDRLEDEIAQTDKKYAENLAAIKRRATELESQLRNEKESHQLSALQHENQVATLSDDIQRLQREVERAKKDRDSSHKRLEDTETEHENQHTALQSMYRATVERLQAEGQLNEKLITQNAEKDREIAKLALQTSREKA